MTHDKRGARLKTLMMAGDCGQQSATMAAAATVTGLQLNGVAATSLPVVSISLHQTLSLLRVAIGHLWLKCTCMMSPWGLHRSIRDCPSLEPDILASVSSSTVNDHDNFEFGMNGCRCCEIGMNGCRRCKLVQLIMIACELI